MLEKARALAGFDTNASIIRCRQFAESLTRVVADESGTEIAGLPFIDQIRKVGAAAGLSASVVHALHEVRILGNEAAHHHLSGEENARRGLVLCEDILAGAIEAIPSLAAFSPQKPPPAELPPDTLNEPDVLVDAVRLLVLQWEEHWQTGLAVRFQTSLDAVHRKTLMTLTSSGIPRIALEEAGVLPAGSNLGGRQHRNAVAGLGTLGFRWAPNDVVKLLPPPDGLNKPSLSPAGAAYFDALCHRDYYEGQMSTQHLQEHVLGALEVTRALLLQQRGMPQVLLFEELSVATKTAFRWDNAVRLILGKSAPQPAMMWTSFALKHLDGWIFSGRGVQPVY